MSAQPPETVKIFLDHIRETKGTIVEIREILPTGKSSAFVALVDCVGVHDGVYVLKIDAVPADRPSEEARHRQALAEHAFSGKLPEIVLSERTDSYYCLLIRIAGKSRISWRPLIGALQLFRSAYTAFAKIAWDANLLTFGAQSSAAEILRSIVGYKLIGSNGGRIAKHLSEFVGPEFLDRPLFLHNGQLLPNPFVFAKSTLPSPMLRPLIGPIHGDCHAQNLFVKTDEDGGVTDVYLIDLATYQSHALFFFDHAYLELAMMLRQMNQLGERRWFELVAALARGGEAPLLEPHERGWFEDIIAARKRALGLSLKSYPDRMDDLRLQFLLAQVGAGLSFMHKTPREGAGSGGLTASQYRQSFVWSAVYLARRKCVNNATHFSLG